MEEFGPVQILVVGFGDGGDFKGEVMDELKRLTDEGIVRLVDLAVVSKDAEGDVTSVEVSGLTDEESQELGALAGAMIGLGMEGDEEGMEAGAIAGAEAAEDGFIGDEEVWSIADAIPPGSTAAVALIEHRWAIGLRDAVRRAGGMALADTWVHPEDLVTFGAAIAEG
jgi:uncharacterized membrane protein